MRNLIMALWIAFLLISIGIGAALYSLYQSGERARVGRGEILLRAACEAIGSRYSEGSSLSAYQSGPAAGRDIALDRATAFSLKSFDGVEGGIWSRERGFVAYAYPTYGGATPKTDVPAAEQPAIEHLARESAEASTPRSVVREDPRETVLLQACPLPGPPAGVVAWTLTRIHSVGPGYAGMLLALGLLLGFVVVSGAGLSMALGRRSVRLTTLERALADYDAEHPRPLSATGDRDLDRIVHAFNALGGRLALAQREAATLGAKVAQSDRLAALGRLSAGLAHEIRNPLAAMRLKAENAIARGPAAGETQHGAIEFLLGQVARLELLVNNLLTMTQAIQIRPGVTRIDTWLVEHVESFRQQALARDVSLGCECVPMSGMIDAFQLGRALDNLVANALQHAPGGSLVQITASTGTQGLLIRVTDAGPGVPAHIRANLFEPFVSGRAEGTGLGLAIVREIAAAHGGSARVLHPVRGACFELEVPWRAS